MNKKPADCTCPPVFAQEKGFAAAKPSVIFNGVAQLLYGQLFVGAFFEQIGFPFLSFDKPDDILPVHEDCKGAHKDAADPDQGIAPMENHETYTEGKCCQHGTQGNILGQQVSREENNADQCAYPPVNAESDEPAA